MTRCCIDMALKAASASSLLVASSSSTDFHRLQQLRIGASSSAAPSGVDLNTLQSFHCKVGTTGFLGPLAGQLPGRLWLGVLADMHLGFTHVILLLWDWGFFVPYLLGSISLVVLGVGSTPPGLLQGAISGISTFFPDYQKRIASHEAAHFLVACLLGLPILGYSLDIGKSMSTLLTKGWKS